MLTTFTVKKDPDLMRSCSILIYDRVDTENIGQKIKSWLKWKIGETKSGPGLEI